MLECDLQGLLDRRRAVGCVEEMGIVDGHDAGQRLGELDHRAVPVAEHRRVCAERELLTDASSSSGMQWPNVLTQSDEIASR